MRRITERMKLSCVLAPAAVAASTETASGYVDVSACREVAFCVAAAAMESGKKLTVALYAADDTSGTNAAKIAEKVFTASEAMTAPVAVVDYKPSAANGRYVCVKIQHDNAVEAGVVCGVTALCDGVYRPQANDWSLAV